MFRVLGVIRRFGEFRGFSAKCKGVEGVSGLS